MGRKNKKAPKASSSATSQPQGTSSNTTLNTPAPELSKSAKRDAAELITSLLEICSKPPESGPKEWEDYPEIVGLVEKIRTIQTVLAPPEKNRADLFPGFVKWLTDHGVDTSSVEISEFPQFGYGLKATRDIKENDKFLQIPRKLMLTVDSAKKSSLGSLIAEDKILQVMPNVTLALHLLNEKLNPESFWKPYIDILPSKYSLPLYWSSEHLQYLKGSPVQGDAINQYRNIARQYAYFYRLLQKNPAANNLLLKDNFTYDNYRWAVASVMTRQNQIPGKDGSRATLGLIPLWDMCNHTNGIFTSDYNSEQDACECFALRNFPIDQQVLIFYGPRSNGEFLVHNGFVYPENEHDRLCLKLGISKGDSLFALKSELLAKLNLAPSRSFYLHNGKFPVDGDLLAFLRVFCMEEGVLKDQYSGETAPGPDELESLKDEDQQVNSENEEKVWTFLQTRANLLLKAYPGTLEEDEATSQSLEGPEAARMSAQLKYGERQILLNTIDYAEKKKGMVKPT
ncbi:actin-histidine N-methyltransferase-like [Physella acuta]|uniref:actin-histidine N-methyltransferase-like n=1 Tax=Physella acuta TaxID=109671 RepID=UPI0027DDBE40|nr:actin-histidine N-methyltransferase-like [Physella acuta]XP_059178141.1 actin-histidine N-methyltransferase-like [Physella acuta]XP_059178142.1 actin-histidine N-methyltransferase-like [Physella acuta]XP_059178143.1 actin-histidine N-methyltransferase-like [Physella acuta]